MNQEDMGAAVAVAATPADALRALETTADLVGGVYSPADADKGAVGRTMFDSASSDDGTVTVLMPQDAITKVPAQAMVRIVSRGDGRVYVGAVAAGPFAEPDGLRADSTPMVVTAVQGGLLVPRYHGRVQVAILGERLDSGSLVPPRRRPTPNSPVFLLSDEETAEALKLSGDMVLGLADGFDDLEVTVDVNSKQFVPRHLAILGTTGGGKSTTVGGLVAKAQAADTAVILIDTEGEYTAIHEPCDDPKMLAALELRGATPGGIPGTTVYHLKGRAPYNPSHPRIEDFTLRFSDLSPFALAEIMDLNEAQQERFIKAYDLTKVILERLKISPADEKERAAIIELDEYATGYPKMRLAHVYDVVQWCANLMNKDPEPKCGSSEFERARDTVKQVIDAASKSLPGHPQSWRKVQGRLGMLRRMAVFQDGGTSLLDYKSMLTPGTVSIIDLSDTDSPIVNNLVIAEILRGVQEQQEENYKAAIAAGARPTPTLVLIEEAHEFLSTHRIAKMPVLFEQVARIARRGRKRWLGIGFITQLPQHLPDDVLGLVNNWILHKIAHEPTVRRLKQAVGSVPDALWHVMPSLAPGQAIVAMAPLSRALRVNIDPAPCKLLMVM